MHLLIKGADGAEQRVRVESDTAVLGRAAHCDVVVDQPYVSKQHAKIYCGVVVVDLESSNGTYVDGEPLRGATLLRDRWVSLGRGDAMVKVEPEPSEAPSSPPPAESAEEGDTPSLLDLQRRNRELQNALAYLRKELKAAREQAGGEEPAADAPGEEGMAKLKKENATLRRHLATLKARLEAPSKDKEPSEGVSAASKLVFQLQRENASLRQQVASHQGAESPATGDALGQLRDLVRNDDEATPTVPDSEGTEVFLMVEGHRFLRRIERLTTRIAGSFIQLLSPATMMPGMEGNLRQNLAQLLENPQDFQSRRDHLGYLQQLGRWLVAAVGAYREAAVAVCGEILEELSEEGLTGSEPIPALKRIAGKREAELWRRLSAHVKELTPEILEERVEKRARASADRILEDEQHTEFS